MSANTHRNVKAKAKTKLSLGFLKICFIVLIIKKSTVAAGPIKAFRSVTGIGSLPLVRISSLGSSLGSGFKMRVKFYLQATRSPRVCRRLVALCGFAVVGILVSLFQFLYWKIQVFEGGL